MEFSAIPGKSRSPPYPGTTGAARLPAKAASLAQLEVDLSGGEEKGPCSPFTLDR